MILINESTHMSNPTDILKRLYENPTFNPAGNNNAMLIKAAAEGNADLVTELIKIPAVSQGPNISCAIQEVVESDRKDILEILFDQLLTTNHINNTLKLAAMRGQTDLIKFIMYRYETDPDAAMGIAVRENRLASIKVLLDHPGLDLNHINDALAMALCANLANISELILSDDRSNPNVAFESIDKMKRFREFYLRGIQTTKLLYEDPRFDLSINYYTPVIRAALHKRFELIDKRVDIPTILDQVDIKLSVKKSIINDWNLIKSSRKY